MSVVVEAWKARLRTLQKTLQDVSLVMHQANLI